MSEDAAQEKPHEMGRILAESKPSWADGENEQTSTAPTGRPVKADSTEVADQVARATVEVPPKALNAAEQKLSGVFTSRSKGDTQY